MKVAAVKKPGGPGNLVIEERPDPKPGHGEVLVRVRASSLNYHDFVVVMGGIPTPDGRIPMSDGACEVVALGEGVTKWKVGDKVLSLFFPGWQSGQIEAAGFQSVPGDGADGFGAELVASPRNRLHPHSGRLDLRGGGDPSVCGAHGLARHVRRGRAQGGRLGADPGHRRRVDLCAAARQGGWLPGDLHLLLAGEARKAEGARRRSCDQLQGKPGLGRARRSSWPVAAASMRSSRSAGQAPWPSPSRPAVRAGTSR